MSLPEIREFRLIFAILGVFCLAGMLLYNRFFSEDTSVANRRAWRIMLVMYGLLTIGGITLSLKRRKEHA